MSMKFKKIPRTELKVSEICLGSMNWGQQNTEAEGHEQLDYALSQGINFIDTAEVYPVPPELEKKGLTEKYIGAWLEKRGKRDDLVLASKVAGPWAYMKSPNRKNVRIAIEGSLSRLKTDYLDLYQVHWPARETNFFGVRGVENLGNDDVPIEETLDALSEEVIKPGKARYIGVSNETPWGLHEYLRLASEKKLPHIVSTQNQYSLINRTFEIGLSEMVMREEIAMLSYSPLSFGVLSGKYLDGARPAGARFTLWDRSSSRYNPPEVQETIGLYADLAKSSGLTPAQMAIAFVKSRPFVTATIVGATSMEQLKADIATADIKLSQEILDGIAKIYKDHPDPHA